MWSILKTADLPRGTSVPLGTTDASEKTVIMIITTLR